MGKKLKVCHFTYSFFPTVGGMEEVIHNLSLAMLSHDCEPFVLAPRLRRQDNTVSVPYEVIRFSRPSSRRFGLRQLLVPLLWQHRKYRFDILHCHSVYPTGYVGASFRAITGVPLVITPHGGDIAKNRAGNIISPRVMSRVRRTFPSADAVTAISSAVRQQILELGAACGKVHLVPNGVYLDEFKPVQPSEKRKAPPYIVFLGRLIGRKGADVLISAYSLLKEKPPGFRLKIAGDGEEMNGLQELVRSYDLAGEIEFLGTVRGDEKVLLLSGALFLVCPSRQEPFGVVNLEAFASGLPVIATRTGGIPDVVEDGVNGFLVEPDNPGQLAEKMRLLIKDHGLRERMSASALCSADRFDWSHVMEDYLDIYRSIMP